MVSADGDGRSEVTRVTVGKLPSMVMASDGEVGVVSSNSKKGA